LVAHIKGGTKAEGVCEYRVLRRIFGSKREEVTEEWGKLSNEEIREQCSSPNIVRVMK